MLAQRDVAAKTNGITQVKPLLDDLDIAGALVTADASGPGIWGTLACARPCGRRWPATSMDLHDPPAPFSGPR